MVMLRCMVAWMIDKRMQESLVVWTLRSAINKQAAAASAAASLSASLSLFPPLDRRQDPDRRPLRFQLVSDLHLEHLRDASPDGSSRGYPGIDDLFTTRNTDPDLDPDLDLNLLLLGDIGDPFSNNYARLITEASAL